MDLSSLPTELIVQIFNHLFVDNLEYLYNTEKVCKLFMNIVRNFRWESIVNEHTSMQAISASFFHHKFSKLTIYASTKNILSWFCEANDVIIIHDYVYVDVENIIKTNSNVLEQNNCKSVTSLYGYNEKIIYRDINNLPIVTSLCRDDKKIIHRDTNNLAIVTLSPSPIPHDFNSDGVSLSLSPIHRDFNSDGVSLPSNPRYFNNSKFIHACDKCIRVDVATSNNFTDRNKFLQCIYYYKISKLIPDAHIRDMWFMFNKLHTYCPPESIFITSCNYNILRVMSGMAGLAFTN